MAENSGIEWCHHTHNHWIGCQNVSPACDFCYAESLVKRYGDDFGLRRLTSEHNRNNPVRWNRKAEALGIRYRVFCSSLSDVFDAEVDKAWRHDLFDLVKRTPNLDWLMLTKRPKVARDYAAEVDFWPLPNVWLGVTAENQKMADLRIPMLLDIPASVHFLSMEPLLGPVDLSSYVSRISWVIVGGESGPKKVRPMEPDWALDVMRQCEDARKPFLFKQWGSYAPGPDGAMVYGDKKKNGRLLDGRLHDGYPLLEAA